jgi:hypothetical protein
MGVSVDPDIGYASEKFSGGLFALATGRGDLNSRLASALAEAQFGARLLKDGLKEKWDRISLSVELRVPLDALEAESGWTALSLKEMPDDEVDELASKFVRLCEDIIREDVAANPDSTS